jgi:hypothetical protein
MELGVKEENKMKAKNTRRVFSVIGLGMLILTFQSTGSAQSTVMRASIPFDFYLADTLMPAGNYAVSPLAGRSVISFADRNGHAAVVMTLPAWNRNPDANRLVFNRYGSTYFLSRLDWFGYQTGNSLYQSKLELEARSKGAPRPAPVALK